MRVLILSSNNGGGHNATASALLEMFTAHGAECRVEDCLSFISEDVSDAVARSHNFVYRHVPKLFASGYRRAKRHPDTFKEHHNGRRVLNLGRRNLGRLLRAEAYDIAVCTHVFGALMLTDACRKYGVKLRTGVVETDYTASPGAQSGDLDWHFIPAESLRGELEALGVPPERIVVSGIPVRAAFCAPPDRAAARLALGIPMEQRHVLIMGGSMGAGPVPELAAALQAQMDGDCGATVVCGTNRALYASLQSAYGADPRFHILGYAPDVPRLMDAADVLMTKPGGITVTEAAMKRLPMVLVESVAGCEAYNLDFFVRAGGAVTADTPLAQAELALSVARDEDLRATMAADLDAIARANDRELIWRKLTE